MQKRRYSLLLFIGILLLVLACGRKQNAERDAQLVQMLTQFFTVRTAVGSADGLWLAQKDSVAAMIEKKFLANYQAKPDEMKKDEIRQRLQNLVVYYRIEGRQFTMLTQVADSVGVNVGILRLRPSGRKGEQVYDARVRGKDGEISATLRYINSASTERLEYTEGDYTVAAERELRPVAVLVQEFRERMQQVTGLPQY